MHSVCAVVWRKHVVVISSHALAREVLAAPNRRLVLPEGDVHGRYFRPSYIETI